MIPENLKPPHLELNQIILRVPLIVNNPDLKSLKVINAQSKQWVFRDFPPGL